MATVATSNSGPPLSLPQLQNLMKRDPESYEDDLEQQLRFFSSQMRIFRQSPADFSKPLAEVVMFLAQVAKCYPKQLADYPKTLADVLREHSTVLDADMRLHLCRAVVLLRHRGLWSATDLVQLFFHLMTCPDKALRKYLRDQVILDIKAGNAKRKDASLNSQLQNFLFKVLDSGEKTAAKMALEILIELYHKGVWKDAKTVNVIASACLSDVTKLTVTGLNFFLGKDENDDKGGDSDSEDELPTVRSAALANKVNRKTKKREKFLQNLKKAHKKKKKKDKAAEFNFSALHLIHDPQGFAEKLYKKLDTLRERFEVKLLFLDLISRLIGTHELIVLGYYEYLARFLNPHQRDVVRMLQFAAQAAHEMVPAESMQPVLRAIVNNFVTERNAAEVMAVGLNAVRELCKRCPLAMDETLLRDLASYKKYKDKGVMMAARSLITLYRSSHPELLHKKDRGRPTEAVAEAAALGSKKFGELSAVDYVPGAEVVAGRDDGENEPEQEDDDDGDDEDGEWVDVFHSSDEEEEDDDEDNSAGSGNEEDEDDEKLPPSDQAVDEKKSSDKETKKKDAFLTLEEKRKLAAEAAASRFFSDADFKRIDSAQLKKQVQAFRKGDKKRKRREEEEDEEEAMANQGREELVDLASIEMVHKKRRHDKEARLETVMKGREGREKFGSRKSKANENASSTHKQKAKKKNFMMIKHKMKSKAKRSFVEKARDLKKALKRSQKFK